MKIHVMMNVFSSVIIYDMRIGGCWFSLVLVIDEIGNLHINNLYTCQ